MTLLELAQSYIYSRIGLSQKHLQNVLSVCRRCYYATGANGHLPNKMEIVRWLQSELEQGRAKATVAHHVRILQAVFSWGAKEGLCDPIVLPKLKVPPPIPEAWTISEFSRLLEAATSMPGYIGACPAKDWWPALLLTLYWTGARLSSVLKAQPGDLHWEAGMLRLQETKNGRTKLYRLPNQALEAIRRIYNPESKRLFEWPLSICKFWVAFRKIILAAGLPYRPYKSGTHKIRRTCLTYCWAADPAIAQRQADHASAELTRRHYIDPRIVQQAKTAADVLPVPEYRPGPVQLRLFPEARTA